MRQCLTLSPLRHTWILDLDGTLLEHNGYKNGADKLLSGAREFIDSIPSNDFILILTAREKETKEQTIKFLTENSIRFDEILFEMPMGERILINDIKPSGLICAHSINIKRNQGLDINLVIDKNL